jgi:hypothetical protein
MGAVMLVIGLAGLGVTLAAIKALTWFVDPKRQERAQIARQLKSGGTELVEGATVTLTGIARPGPSLLKAPYACVPCIAYTTRCEVAARDGSEPPKDIERVAAVPFTLDTEQGAIAIDPTPTPKADVVGQVAFVRSFGYTAENVYGHDFTETIIRDGDRVKVAGVVAMSTVATGEAGYRETRTVARIVDHPRFPLRITPAR